MSGFFELSRKKYRKIIGILSGTSVDAIDVVLVTINNRESGLKLRVIDFDSFPISRKLRNEILSVSDNKTGTVSGVCTMNVKVGVKFAENVNSFLRSRKLSSEDIDLIGSHGQTVCHLPSVTSKSAHKFNSTLQLGDPSVIAGITGITTVGDFRMADIGAGGSGAPLVPYLDYVLFKSQSKSRILVNIGGIANITYLPKSANPDSICAFDTGPGNMVIDSLMNKLFGKAYDNQGKVSGSGITNEALLRKIISSDKFWKLSPPKSAGRENYGSHFADKILTLAGRLKAEDIISTVTGFTAYCIYSNCIKFEADEVLVSGGGSKNKTLMRMLSSYFRNSAVKPVSEFGINSDNKEAVLFALLANEVFSGRKANIPSVTGAGRSVLLGKICPA